MGVDPAVPSPPDYDATFQPSSAVPESLGLAAESEAWRLEVAARLERYRARRKPRAPRYPSLLLPFDSHESWSRAGATGGSAATVQPSTEPSDARSTELERQATASKPAVADSQNLSFEEPETTAKVIEFPRSAAVPIAWTSELAEPVLDRPRIVEAPEILPPPPALGGILIEPPAPKEPERRAGSEFPVRPASQGQRLLAALVDGLIVSTALAAFVAVVVHFNPQPGPYRPLVAGVLTVGVVLWFVYEFLILVYTGSTPGLRALRLQLVRFDGSPVNRRTRRWRVLASLLSAASLGLGYLWSVLDEDGLCWHDRITRSHIQVRGETD